MNQWQQIFNAMANGFAIALLFFTIFGGVMAFIVYRQQQRERRR